MSMHFSNAHTLNKVFDQLSKVVTLQSIQDINDVIFTGSLKTQ